MVREATISIFGFSRSNQGASLGSPQLSLQDKLLSVGAILNDHPEAAIQLRSLAAQRDFAQKQLAAQQGYQDKLTAAFSPQYQDGPPIDVKPPTLSFGAGSNPDDLSTPNLPVPKVSSAGPAPTYVPPRKVSNGLTIDDPRLAGLVLGASAPGVNYNIGPVIDLLKAQRPDISVGPGGEAYNQHDPSVIGKRFRNPTNVNGSVIDLNNPNNEGLYTPEAPVKGALPVYDNRGHIVDWNLPGGTARSIGAAKAAEVGAEEATKAGYVFANAKNQAAGTGEGASPYAIETHDVNGVPTTGTRRQFIDLAGGSPGPSFNTSAAASALSSIAPGAQITSTTRSQARNAAVGGVPDSMHLSSQAVDFVPPKGLTLQAFKDRLTQAGLPATELIDEGTHFHWGWGPKGQASAQPQPATTGFHGVNPDDKKRVDAALEDAASAENVSRLGHQYQELNKKTYTGPLFNAARVHVPLIGDVPINPISGLGASFQPGAQAMDNMSMQMATGLRAPGQRLTQAEIFQNLKTVPNRTSLPSSNDTSVQSYDQRAVQKRAYANFISNYLAKSGTLNGADEAWAEQGKIRTYNPKTGALE